MALTKLNKNHIEFVREYLANGKNASRAYGTVYGCDSRSNNARTQSCKLLKDTLIQKEIERQTKEMEKDNNLTIIDLLYFLKCVFNTNVTDFVKPIKSVRWVTGPSGKIEQQVVDLEFVDVDKLTTDEKRVIKQISKTDRGSVDLRLYDKMDALNSICKIIGLLDKEDQSKVVNAVIDTSFLKGLSTAELKKMLKDDK